MGESEWIRWCADRDAWLWTGGLMLALIAAAAVVAAVVIGRR